MEGPATGRDDIFALVVYFVVSTGQKQYCEKKIDWYGKSQLCRIQATIVTIQQNVYGMTGEAVNNFSLSVSVSLFLSVCLAVYQSPLPSPSLSIPPLSPSLFQFLFLPSSFCSLPSPLRCPTFFSVITESDPWRYLSGLITTYFTCLISIHGRCHVLPCLIKINVVVARLQEIIVWAPKYCIFPTDPSWCFLEKSEKVPSKGYSRARTLAEFKRKKSR